MQDVRRHSGPAGLRVRPCVLSCVLCLAAAAFLSSLDGHAQFATTVVPPPPTEFNFSSQGHLAVPGGRIWYGVVGERRKGEPPMLVIHGGPGLSHHYLYPLTALSASRQLIFYDQLDAGSSEWPNDPKNWNVPRYLAEIDALRSHLGLDSLIMFGNSWGGTIAAAYAARRPPGLTKLILSGPLIDTRRWVADNAVYRAALPAGAQEATDRYAPMALASAPHSHSTAASTSRRCVRASPPETPRARPLRRRRTSSTGGTCAGGTRGPTLWRRLSSRASSTSGATRACGDRRSSSPPACSATTTARRSSRALMCPRCSRAASSTRRRPTPRGEI